MYSAIDTLWMIFAIVLIFTMQAGFTMLETGLTRSRNSANIAMKNLLDFAAGTLAFWLAGFGILYGASHGGWIGSLDLFSRGSYGAQYPGTAFIAFQMMFCATSATIVSGAMAERTKFKAYLIYSILISALVYPISGHWIWNADGWLNQLGFHDLAGSTAVHLVGGTAALVGARMLGPRLGKYNPDGSSNAIPGRSQSLCVLGLFLLWIGWYGFNAGSTLTLEGDAAVETAADIILNTTLCAATSCVTGMLLSWRRYGKPDPSITFDSALGGLVAITAGADQVQTGGAVCIGLIAGFAVVFSIEFVDLKLKIDDPAGAISVHGVCGALGTILTGVFSTSSGLLYTGSFRFLGVQILGVAVTFCWVAVAMLLIFGILKHTIGLRVSEAEEIAGLDVSEHGLRVNESSLTATDVSAVPSPTHLVQQLDLQDFDPETAPAQYRTADGKIHKVVVVMNQDRLAALLPALDKIGVTGMTVTSVSGCGIQKGHTEFYRGSCLNTQLLPKIKVEIVISTVPLLLLVDTIKKSIYTGNIGDGKIFIYELENVIKVRTGAEGTEALE